MHKGQCAGVWRRLHTFKKKEKITEPNNNTATTKLEAVKSDVAYTQRTLAKHNCSQESFSLKGTKARAAWSVNKAPTQL